MFLFFRQNTAMSREAASIPVPSSILPGSGEALPGHARRGRGAISNRSGRYESLQRMLEDDGWEGLARLDRLPTTVTRDTTRSIITRNQSPDIFFDRSINPYRGCEHGCSYCFARPTHAYLGLSPGLDFETRLFAKPEAAALLKNELAQPGYKPAVLAMGTNTDPYQPIEREWKITRSVLEVLAAHHHPVSIVTKSHLILRDIDILTSMAGKGLAKVALSITTLDRKLARKMEPRAPTPEKRLEAVKELSEAGIPTAVMVAPIIPALNDSEMENILKAAALAGATEAGYVLLRLPLEIKDLFRQWLIEAVPDKARHVMSLVRSTRAGRDYDSNWTTRQRGEGAYAQLIAKRFAISVKRHGLNKTRSHLDVSQFKPPPTEERQLRLF
jgi:DNA repair photolyase